MKRLEVSVQFDLSMTRVPTCGAKSGLQLEDRNTEKCASECAYPVSFCGKIALPDSGLVRRCSQEYC